MTQPPAPAPVPEGTGGATQQSAVAPHPAVSIVVPTYNERERLEEFVRAVFDVLSTRHLAAELVIVDDNSPDGTGALADRLARELPIRVVHRPGKLGLGGAVMAGFAAATGDVLGVMDADLSHPPEAIPAVIRALEETGADIVVASRYVPGGGTRNWPLSRAVMSKAACLLARPLTPVRDAASGFFVLRREALQAVGRQGDGVQDLPRAARAEPASFDRRAALRVYRSGGGGKQDERRGGPGLPDAGLGSLPVASPTAAAHAALPPARA